MVWTLTNSDVDNQLEAIGACEFASNIVVVE